MNALKKVLAKVFKDDFTPFKAENGEKLPNRVTFTGDKPVSKTGDPAKVENNAWHRDNAEFKKFRNKEKKDDYTSLVVTPDGRQETMLDKVANQHKWFRKFTNVLDAPEDKGLSTDIPDNVVGVGMPEQTSAPQNTVSSTVKSNWRQTLSYSEPDINLKRKPDGTMELNVTHPAGNANEQETETIPAAAQSVSPDNSSSTTMPGTGQAGPTQNTATSSLQKEACKEAGSDVNEWIIRKEGNLVLLGRECKDKAGIFILKFPEGSMAKAANLQDKLSFSIFKQIVDKNGHTWQELINSSVWQAKFDDLVKQKK
jgi:hypothetical protein